MVRKYFERTDLTYSHNDTKLKKGNWLSENVSAGNPQLSSSTTIKTIPLEENMDKGGNPNWSINSTSSKINLNDIGITRDESS